MIRRVSMPKAVVAGVCGALAWEAVMRALIVAGVPMFDITFMLGSIIVVPGPQNIWQWWLIGIALHAMVGVAWSVFYSYFFWSELPLPPPIQGLIFAAVPMMVAGLVMLPQIDSMHPLVLGGSMPSAGIFALRLGWSGPTTIVLGHAIFGLVMGTIYRNPVGYRVGKRRVRGIGAWRQAGSPA